MGLGTPRSLPWVQHGQRSLGGESPGRYGLKSKQRSLITRLVPQNGARYTSSSLGAAIREPAGERGGRRSGFHRDTRVSKAGKAKASISQMCHLGIGTSWLDRKEENILRGAQAPGFHRGSRGSGSLRANGFSASNPCRTGCRNAAELGFRPFHSFSFNSFD